MYNYHIFQIDDIGKVHVDDIANFHTIGILYYAMQ